MLLLKVLVFMLLAKVIHLAESPFRSSKAASKKLKMISLFHFKNLRLIRGTLVYKCQKCRTL